jgi:hypothetical protein
MESIGEIIIYKNKENNISLNVRLEDLKCLADTGKFG